MRTYALIHGAWTSSWGWHRFAPVLQERGHRVVAVDMPCSLPGLTCSDYASVVVDALGDTEDVVVVGSSLAGLTAPLVASRRPVREIVVVGALLPERGKSLSEQRGNIVDGALAGTAIDEQGRSYWADQDAAIAAGFHDIPDELKEETKRRLRPQALDPFAERFPLDAWPDVPTKSVVCDDDRIVDPDWSRRAARERLGIEPLEIPGGHAPMFSRPEELADLVGA